MEFDVNVPLADVGGRRSPMVLTMSADAACSLSSSSARRSPSTSSSTVIVEMLSFWLFATEGSHGGLLFDGRSIGGELTNEDSLPVGRVLLGVNALTLDSRALYPCSMEVLRSSSIDSGLT